MSRDAITASTFASMQNLKLAEQVSVLEGVVAEHGIAESADVIAIHLLSVSMDMDGGTYPADLVARVDSLKARVREFNQQRFGAAK